eukprot:TRINITY_DN62641_c0_g1_i1.p1 TRINITY_DN62641_c0_g1~~TRINITY_DN62641_c0_g1_i1.p1  ORF type:complete len:487 (-),score=70.39 TRINITY_DN62641_c0_g1_i1:46-1422(-)
MVGRLRSPSRYQRQRSRTPPSLVLGAGAPTATSHDNRCHSGCGYQAAWGLDNSGFLLETCCRSCSLGQGHDETCQRIPVNATDAEVARAMQFAELKAATTSCSDGGEPGDMLSSPRRPNQETTDAMYAATEQKWELTTSGRWIIKPLVSVWDPVWGELRGINGPPTQQRQLLFTCFPCIAIGCGNWGCEAVTVRRAWRRFLLSWSFLFAGVQLAMLAGAIAMNDFFTQGLGPNKATQDESLIVSFHPLVLDLLGAKNAARILWWGEWWRLLTPMALHGSWFHLLSNLSVQLRTGVMLEVLFGHSTWLLVYVSSGAFGTLSSCLASPSSLSVGSSGALSGIIGSWFVFILITWEQIAPSDVKRRNTEFVSVSFSFLCILVVSWFPMVDLAAHVGGLAAGCCMAMALFGGRLETRVSRTAMISSGIALSVGLWVGALLLFLLETRPDDALLHLCSSHPLC